MDCNTPGLTVHHQHPEFTQIHVHWINDAFQPSCPLSSPSPPNLSLSQPQGLFKWVSFSHQVARVLEFQLRHRSFQWTFRADFLAVQGTLKSLLQHHSSKASILRCSAFFIVQLSHPYMTTGKVIALTRQTFVGKVMSVLFHMLSGLVITFLPRNKYFFNFMTTVTICSDFGAKVFHCFPIYLSWSGGTRCHDLSFLNVEFEANYFTLLFHFCQEAF